MANDNVQLPEGYEDAKPVQAQTKPAQQVKLPAGYEDATPVQIAKPTQSAQVKLPAGYEDAKPVPQSHLDSDTAAASARLQSHPIEGAEFRAVPSTWERFKGAVEHPVDYLADVESDTQQGGGRTVVGRALGHAQHGSMSDTGYTADKTAVAPLIAGPIQGPPKVLRGALRIGEQLNPFTPKDSLSTREMVGGINEAVGGAIQTPGAALLASPEALVRGVPAVLGSTYAQKGLKAIGVPDEYAELGGNLAGAVGAMTPEDPMLAVRTAAKVADVIPGKAVRAGLKKILPESMAPAVEENIHMPGRTAGLQPSEKANTSLQDTVRAARERLQKSEEKLGKSPKSLWLRDETVVPKTPELIPAEKSSTPSLNGAKEAAANAREYARAKEAYQVAVERAAANQESMPYERAVADGMPYEHKVGTVEQTGPMGRNIDRTSTSGITRPSEYFRKHAAPDLLIPSDKEIGGFIERFGKPTENAPSFLPRPDTSVGEARSSSGVPIPREIANVISSKPQSTEGAPALGNRIGEAQPTKGIPRIETDENALRDLKSSKGEVEVSPEKKVGRLLRESLTPEAKQGAKSTVTPEAPAAEPLISSSAKPSATRPASEVAPEAKPYDLSKPVENPKGLRTEGAALSSEALEAQPAVRQKVFELGNAELDNLARAHGIDPTEHQYSRSKEMRSTEGSRHQTGRQKLADDIVATVGDAEMQNLGRAAENLKDNPDMAGKAIKDRAKSIFPRLRGSVDEFGNPSAKGGSQGVTSMSPKELRDHLKTEWKEEPGKGYGESNTGVTKADKDAAVKRFNDKATRSNAGIDPTMLKDAYDIARFHIEAGARAFSDFAAEMTAQLGESIKPHLKALYEHAKADKAPSGADTLEAWTEARDKADVPATWKGTPESWKAARAEVDANVSKAHAEALRANNVRNNVTEGPVEPAMPWMEKPASEYSNMWLRNELKIQTKQLAERLEAKGMDTVDATDEAERLVYESEKELAPVNQPTDTKYDNITDLSDKSLAKVYDKNSAYSRTVNKVIQKVGIPYEERVDLARDVMAKFVENVKDGWAPKSNDLSTSVMSWLKTVAHNDAVEWHEGGYDTGEKLASGEPKLARPSEMPSDTVTNTAGKKVQRRAFPQEELDFVKDHTLSDASLKSKALKGYLATHPEDVEFLNAVQSAAGHASSTFDPNFKIGRELAAKIGKPFDLSAVKVREHLGDIVSDIRSRYYGEPQTPKAPPRIEGPARSSFGRITTEKAPTVAKPTETYGHVPLDHYSGLPWEDNEMGFTGSQPKSDLIPPLEHAPSRIGGIDDLSIGGGRRTQVGAMEPTHGAVDDLGNPTAIENRSISRPLTGPRPPHTEAWSRPEGYVGAGQALPLIEPLPVGKPAPLMPERSSARGASVNDLEGAAANRARLTELRVREAEEKLSEAKTPTEQRRARVALDAANEALENSKHNLNFIEGRSAAQLPRISGGSQGADGNDTANDYIKQLAAKGIHGDQVENLIERVPSAGKVIEGVEDEAKRFGTTLSKQPELQTNIEAMRQIAHRIGEENRAARAPEEAKISQAHDLIQKYKPKPSAESLKTLGSQKPVLKAPESLKERAASSVDYKATKGELLTTHEAFTKNAKGEELGKVRAVAENDNPDVWTVREASSAKPGTQAGTRAYMTLLDKAEKAGATVRGDAVQSAEARGVWDKMKRAGYNISYDESGRPAFKPKPAKAPVKASAAPELPRSLGGGTGRTVHGVELPPWLTRTK